MKWLFSGVAALLMATTAAQAADQGPYVRLDTGWSFSRDASKDLNDDVGDSYIIGAGAGYRLNQHLRVDATLGYRGGYEIDTNSQLGGVGLDWKGDVSALTGLVNVYGDIGKFGMFTPYVGAGVGFSRNKVDDIDVSALGVTGKLDGDTNTSFAWQVSAGVGIEVAPRWTMDIGYRYLDMGEAKSGTSANVGGVTVTGNAEKGDLRAHEVQVGVRYAF